MDAVAASGDPVAAWLQFGLQRHGRVKIVGFRNAEIPIDLDRVFVPLHVYADPRRQGGGPDPREDKDGLGHGGAEISFDDALARASDGRTCLVLIGDPGAGKTTLLRHLFRRVVMGEVAGPVAHLRGLHPVLVRLATVTDGEQVARGLAQVVTRVATEDGYPEAGRAVLARPDRGFLFLLDGLDEVRDEPTRRRICAWLNREIDHWPACGFVVTSRRAAWARTPDLGARFLPVSVQGLHQDAREEYVRRWFRAVERHFFQGVVSPAEIAEVEARASRKAAALLAVLATPAWRTSSRLLEMAANPLMLSTLCLAHYNDTRLPEQRGELYERTLGLLIEVWTREREGGPPLRMETARLVLQPLAYAMHEQDRRDLSVEEAAALIHEPLRQVTAWLTTQLDGLVARLPTEAEWEFAARGSDGRRYPWGNAPPDALRATFGQPYDRGRPAVVGQTPGGKSPFDVHDLAGNVWGWCLDAWADSYVEIQADGVDPCHHTDDTRGGARVVRGGSWNSPAGDLRSSWRYWVFAQIRYRYLGIRVACGGSRQPDPR